MYEQVSTNIISLIYLVVLCVVYFLKRKYNFLESKIYKTLLITNIVLLVLDVVCVYTGNVGSMLESGLNTIGNAAALSQSVPATVGGNGSMTFENTWKLVGRFFDIADEDLASRGRPLCAARTLSNLAGYIQCSDADPEISCTDEEMAAIVNYLNSGFYME